MSSSPGATLWESLEQQRTTVTLLDDVKSLPASRMEAAQRGVLWIGLDVPGESRPLGLWQSVLEVDGDGPRPVVAYRDDDNPLLPDAAGVYAAIAANVCRLVAHHPTVVALTGLDRACEDSLQALQVVLRCVQGRPAAFLLVGRDSRGRQTWGRFCERLQREHDVLRIAPQGGVDSDDGPLSGGPQPSVAEGMRWCAAGALHGGARLLARALAEPDASGDGLGWHALAMAALQLHESETARHASIQALRLLAGRELRRARRTYMMTLRQLGHAEMLARAGAVCRREADAYGTSPTQRAWNLLDVALGTSLQSDAAEHVHCLDRILAMPAADVSPHCLAAAHLWRGAAYLVGGDLQAALDQQLTGLDWLERLGERTRALHVRSRVGALCVAVGRLSDGARILNRAAHDAVVFGEPLLAAINTGESIGAFLAAGDIDGARAGIPTGWTAGHVWASPLGQRLHLRVRAQIALAEGDLDGAELACRTLVHDLDVALAGQPTWILRLACEASFLQADLARARGTSSAHWVQRGLRLAAEAPLEDRAFLEAVGARRLSR